MTPISPPFLVVDSTSAPSRLCALGFLPYSASGFAPCSRQLSTSITRTPYSYSSLILLTHTPHSYSSLILLTHTPHSYSSLMRDVHTQRLITTDSLRASLAQDSLPYFIRLLWSVVEPTTPLSWNWHLDVLCDALTQVSDGGIKKLLINIPPGFMKSLLISVMWPAWEWCGQITTRNASLRYLTFSYTSANTIRDNLRVRDLIRSDLYKRLFPHVQLRSDKNAKVGFNTTLSGYRTASSVGGQGTGSHPHRIIIDDPSKAADSGYPAALAATNKWYDATIPTRVALNPALLVIMQRLHMSDLSAHLLAQPGWTHICLPMRHNPSKADPRDRRTITDELLWPQNYPEDKVRDIEIPLGAFGIAGQLQQDPIPMGGGVIKRDWIPVIESLPKGTHLRKSRGWDIAETQGAGNWTVGVLLGIDDSTGIIYILHAVRLRESGAGVDRQMYHTAKSDGYAVSIREGSGSGKSVIEARAKRLSGYDYAAMPEGSNTSKPSRFRPFATQAEYGNVRMLIGEWNMAYMDVLTSFPVGKYDDDADATSNAFNSLVQGTPETRTVLWGKDGSPAKVPDPDPLDDGWGDDDDEE